MRVAEGVGFEPTDLSVIPFQAGRLQPLGHPSRLSDPAGDRGRRALIIKNVAGKGKQKSDGPRYGFAMRSSPSMYGRSASGMSTLPSAC